MFIRVANQTDCKDVFDWRNDPESRKMFFDTKNVAYQDHCKWFLEAIESPLKRLFIGENGGEKIGVCRFDYNENQVNAEISINLNPKFRNKGLGRKLLIAAIESYQTKNNCTLIARIKCENEASKRVFLSAGFKIVNENETEILVQKNPDKITFKKSG